MSSARAIGSRILRSTKIRWLAILVAIFFLEFLYLYSISESYCFFYPSIDTTYSKGFTEEKFDKIQAGMTAQNVKEILGEPLSKDSDSHSSTWWYSQDGKWKWGDWAWLGRSVEIKNGIVIGKDRRIFYD